MEFKDYFKFRAQHYYVLLLDICYYLITFLGISLYSGFLENWLQKVGEMDPASLLSLPEEELGEVVAMLSGFWTGFVVYSILFIIFLILSYGFFKSVIWGVVIKKKIEIKFILKFTLMNIAWLITIIFILDLIALITGSGTFQDFNFLSPVHVILRFNILHPVAFILISLLILHTTALLQIYFVKEGIKGIKHALLSFKKSHIFILNYIYAIIPLIAVLIIGFLLQFLPIALNAIMSFMVIIAFITWLRFHILDVVEHKIK